MGGRVAATGQGRHPPDLPVTARRPPGGSPDERERPQRPVSCWLAAPAPRAPLALSRYELVVVPRRRLNSTSGSRSAQATLRESTPFSTGTTSMLAAYLVSGGGGPGGVCAGTGQAAAADQPLDQMDYAWY